MTAVFASWQWMIPAPVVPRPMVTMRDIFADVCAEHLLPSRDVMGLSRRLPLVRARQDFMWRCRQVRYPNGSHRYSLPMIAAFLGGMDHTTVLHGVRAHIKRMESAA